MNILAAKFVQDLRGLSRSEKSVALNIAIHADYKNAEADMSMTTLAAESGLKNRETASRVVKKLEFGYGIIEVVGSRSGGKRPTKYKFTFAVNRDSGVTVKEEDNRDSAVTPPVTLDSGNRDSAVTPPVTLNAPTVTLNAPTVTPQSHEGFKVLEGREGEKEGQTTPPSPTSNSKTSGQGKASRSVAVSLAEIKNWAWDVSRNALFVPKSDGLISAWLQSHQDVDRPNLQKTVRSIVDGLDDFGLKTCGNTIASNLDRAEHDAKSDAAYATEQARQEQWVNDLIAEERRKSEEEDKLREERNSTPSPTAEEMFGVAPAEEIIGEKP